MLQKAPYEKKSLTGYDHALQTRVKSARGMARLEKGSLCLLVEKSKPNVLRGERR